MVKTKTEAQRRKDYENKQTKIYERFHKKIDKARIVHKKASAKVNFLESEYNQAREEASRKFWAAKRKRTKSKKGKKKR